MVENVDGLIAQGLTLQQVMDTYRGYTLLFTRGTTYTVTGALQVHAYTELNLNGATLKLGANLNTDVLLVGSYGTNDGESVTIRNGTIDGSNGAGNTQSGSVAFYSCNNLLLKNLDIKNCAGSAPFFVRCTDYQVICCTSSGNTVDGFSSYDGCRNGLFDTCYSTHNQYGFLAQGVETAGNGQLGSHGISYVNCHADANRSDGWGINTNATGIRLDAQCRATRNTGNGVHIKSSTPTGGPALSPAHIWIAGTYSYNLGDSGIKLDDDGTGAISGCDLNVLAYGNKYGVNFQGNSTACSVSGDLRGNTGQAYLNGGSAPTTNKVAATTS